MLELPRISPISTAAVVCFVAILILTGRWLNTDSRERPDTSSARTGTAASRRATGRRRLPRPGQRQLPGPLPTAADRLGFAVPCPGLLPTPAPGVPPPRLCEEPPTCQRGRFLRFQGDGFQIPIGYRGPADYGTLGIVAAPTGGAGRLLQPYPDERRVAAPTVHQIRAVPATCAEEGQQSSWGGRMLLRRSQQGASPHGPDRPFSWRGSR